MIRSYRHAGLREILESGLSRRVRPDLWRRLLLRLKALDRASSLDDLALPGFHLHPLRGKPRRYSLHVNGPWRLTFEWDEGDAWRVDLEKYH